MSKPDSMPDVLERIEKNARQLMDTYPTSAALMQTAISEAMGWAVPLKMKGKIPGVDKLERLATQLVAILAATYDQKKADQQPIGFVK